MKYISILILFFAICSSMQAQIQDETIFKAMTDEMDRNMNELKYKEYEKPFFILYALQRGEQLKITANLGAEIKTSNRDISTYAVSVKVGDYGLNDEKFIDKTNNVHHYDGDFPLPKKLSYFGIRRSFWMATNNDYKRATEVYKNKLEMIEKQGLDVAKLGINDFSEEKPTEFIQESLERERTSSELRKWVVDISSELKKYDELLDSKVVLEYQNKDLFEVNSEGTRIKLPFRFYSLCIKASVLSKENQEIEQTLEYYGKSFHDLPLKETFAKDIAALVDNLGKMREATMINGKFDGPLVLEDEAVVTLLVSKLFAKGNGLIANPKSLVNDKDNGLHLPTWSSWASAIGRKTTSRNMSVFLTPHLNEYNGMPLLGCISTDLEGVTAEDSISLIDKGILTQQLVGRTPTLRQNKSLGHTVPYVNAETFFPAVGPSVVQLVGTAGISDDKIAEELATMIAEEDLEYSYTIRPLDCSANKKPLNFYRTNTETGVDEMIRCVDFQFTPATLKEIKALSDKQLLSNIVMPNMQALRNKRKRFERAPKDYKKYLNDQIGTQGTPCSVIYPSKVLIETIELEGKAVKVKGRNRIVSSPISMR